MAADRGSDLLMQRCPFVIGEEAIAQIAKIVEGNEGRFQKWWCYGQPNPDAVFGTVHVGSIDRVGSLVRDLLQIDGVPLDLDVFPLGIPIPDLFQVNFRTLGR